MFFAGYGERLVGRGTALGTREEEEEAQDLVVG